MAYCTASELKAYLGIDVSTDDVLVAGFIERAQAMIDVYTGRTFEATADAERTFDAAEDVDGLELYVDDLCSITSITNGDGTTVTTAQYTTKPRRATPYYAIRLLGSSGVLWTYTNDPENAITIDGRWAYSTTAPYDIQQACIRLAAWLYRQRENRTGDEDRTIIAGNATVLPTRIPADVMTILNPYRRQK